MINKIIISNAAEKEATIKIRGYIGVPEYWQFDPEKEKEYTATKEKMESDIKAITEIKATKISLDIDSFGGDVNHAFSIYNALTSLTATINVKYTGWSASAATIIAAVGNTITASENTFLLYHQSRTMAYGTLENVQSTANMLKKTDETLVKHYVNQGAKEQDVIELIGRNGGEGEWITANEAKELGLITDVENTYSVAANYNPKVYGLPNLPTNNNNQQLDKMNAEERKTLVASIVDGITSVFKKDQPEVKEIKILDHADVVAKIDELGNSIEAKTSEITDLLAKIEALNAEKETISNQLTEKQNEIEALQATKTEVNQTEDPKNIDGSEPKLSKNELAAKANAAALGLI